MAAHDEQLAAELARSTRLEAARAAGAGRVVEPVVPAREGPTISTVEIPLRFRVPPGVSAEQLSRAVTLAAVRATADPFEMGMGHLEAYLAQHGSAAVPEGWCSPDGFALSRWCATQQRLQAQGRLADERFHRLAPLPGWKWSHIDPDWERGYGVLHQFVRGHRHARVPLGWIDRRGFWLGSWVMSIRAAYHAGILAPDRRLLLETLPGWTWGPVNPSAGWRPVTPPRPGRRRMSDVAPESRWQVAVRVAAKRLPMSARVLGAGQTLHARWSPSDATGQRPSPLKALIDALRPWLHRHIGPEATRTLARAFELPEWFGAMLNRRYERPTETAAEARNRAREWLVRAMGGVELAVIEGAPDLVYGLELERDRVRAPLVQVLRSHFPLLKGWAPPPIDEWRDALMSVLMYGLVHAAVPIAAGLDRRALAFRELRRWSRRRWGQRASDPEWLTRQLLVTTFGDPATSELWLGTNDPVRAERALIRRLSASNTEDPDRAKASSRRHHRLPSLRVQLARAARETADSLAQSLTGKSWSTAQLTVRGGPLQVQWHGRAPSHSASVTVPRHLVSAIRYVRGRRWNDRLPERTRSGEIAVLAARPAAIDEPNARAWIAIWERRLEKGRRVLEAGRLIRRGTITTAEVWQTAMTSDGRLASPGYRGSGLLTWPPCRSSQAPASVREEIARPGRNAAHQAVLPDGTVSQDRTGRWEYNLRAAASYAVEHGHLRPGRQDRPMGINLWMWLRSQELRMDQGTLEPERLAALEALPAWQDRQRERRGDVQREAPPR
jgi:hypothetical protein